MVEKKSSNEVTEISSTELPADEGTDEIAGMSANKNTAMSGDENTDMSTDVSDSGTPKKKRNKKLILGVSTVVVIAAVVLGGVGFTVWHDQPGFCNTICHEPMDAYVDGYNNDDTTFLAAHKTEQVNCIDCHDPGIQEQVKEGILWAQGDYMMNENTNMLATVGVRADSKQCATPECHDFDQVISLTENYGGEEGVNPHKSHQGTAIDCSNCHSSHETSYMFCNTCHDYQLPAGWANPVKADTTL